jgi:flagellar biosynthesis protein FlhF
VKVKRYTTATMQEAIDQIRRDLGPNAVILHSRKVGRGGVLSLLGKPVIEVTAAVDGDAPAQTKPEPARRAGGGGQGEPATDNRLAAYLDSLRPGQTPGDASALTEIAKGNGVVEGIRRQLVGNDVDELLAEALLRAAIEELRTTENAGLIKEYIERRVERFMRVTGPIKCEPGTPSVVALVGPTGVGKTTTAAKLAAHFSALERKRVVIVTVDVYRVAAVEQMRVYAKLLKVPIEVVLTPTDLRGAIAAHRDADLVLIDSGGRSQYDWMQVLELTEFLKAANEAKVHLVLSAATRCRENLAAVERFSSMNVQSLLFTKLDETRDYGSLLTLAVKSKRPISYLTTGQGIPEAIEPASSAKLARMILRTETEQRVPPGERDPQAEMMDAYARTDARL